MVIWELLLAATAMFVSSGIQPTENARSDGERLQGTWVLAEVELGGRRAAVPPQIQGHTRLIVTKESFSLLEGIGKHPGKYRLTATAGEIDLTAHDATLHGLFRVDKDTLWLCTAPGERRPTGLHTREEDGCILQVFRREGSDSQADAAAARELKLLEGVWELVPPKESVDKSKPEGKRGPKTHLVVRGGEASWVVDGKQIGESGRLWVNPSASPKVLSLQVEELRIDGSYELTANGLTLHYHALPSGDRQLLHLRRVAR